MVSRQRALPPTLSSQARYLTITSVFLPHLLPEPPLSLMRLSKEPCSIPMWR